MMLFFRIPLFAIVLGIVTFPGLASAESLPVAWTYTANVQTTTGLGVLNLGTHRLLYDSSGNGTVEPVSSDYVITTPLPENQFSGTYPSYPGQTNEPIPLFWIGWGYSVDPVDAAPAADQGFLLTFTLTDSASGQSGTIEFEGSAGVSATNDYPPLVLFSSSIGPEVTELQLGQNLYRVTAFGGLPDEIEEAAMVGVKIEAIAATPEPSTLAAAAIGLAAVGLIRRHPRSWF